MIRCLLTLTPIKDVSMPSASRLASLTAAFVVLAASVQPANAQATSPGWMYTTNMTIDSGNVGKSMSMAMKYQVTARNLRMEFVQVSGVPGGGMAEGMSMVLDDADSTMTMIMSSQHTAMVMGLTGMFGDVVKSGTSMAPKFAQHLTQNNIEDLGPAEKILGHATHKYRVTTAGTMDVTMMGQTCSQPMDAVMEMWIAPDVDLGPAMQSMGKHFGTVLGMGDIMDGITGLTSKLPKGTPLRTISKTNRAGSVPVTSTVEYVELSQAPIPASAFAVPSDYQTMDMRKMMADVPAGMLDSAMASGAAKGREASTNPMCNRAGKP